MNLPDFGSVLAAQKTIKKYIHNTPILTSKSINKITGADIFFKCENFQKVGAFKIRGATNAIFSLSESELPKGVATHSSGNHAQAVSLAAKWNSINAYIVMPKTSPRVKVNAVRDYEGKITFCAPTLKARERGLKEVVKRSGATFIHPYDNPKVIAGQGTAALEIFSELGYPDFVITPVGGGGLISGTSLSSKNLSHKTKIIGAEPEGADDAYRSFKNNKLIPSKNPSTIADGLLTSLSPLTFTIINKYVDDILTVNDETIKKAMRYIWERMKIIVEPSAAVPLGVILANKKLFAGKKVAVILSGGNVDLNKCEWY